MLVPLYDSYSPLQNTQLYSILVDNVMESRYIPVGSGGGGSIKDVAFNANRYTPGTPTLDIVEIL